MDGKRKTPLCCAIRNRFVYLKRSRAVEDENNKHSLQVNDAPSSSLYTRQITICYLNNNSKDDERKMKKILALLFQVTSSHPLFSVQ